MKALLAACVLGTALLRSAARVVLTKVAAPVKKYPISKVVTLLRDMQKQLEKEGDDDEEVYNKMACWCKENDKTKTLSIADAETRVAELTTVIETASANSARLQQEIMLHEKDLVASQESLSTATALREKQAAEFNGEEKDMLQSIKSLDAAITVLKKHHKGTAFLDDNVLGNAVKVARAQWQRHKGLLLDKITPRQRRVVLALRQDQPYADSSPTFKQAFVPQSSEIFGILNQMKETFEANLSQSQKEELENRRTYEAMRAAKEEEIRATQAAIEQKRTQLAQTDEKKAQSKEDISDTRSSLSIDDTFLLDVKARCAATDKDWESRQKMRQDEISAVVEAIAILNKDEARDAFSRTFNPTALFQRRSRQRHIGSGRGGRGARAAALLEAASAKVGDLKLIALAASARADPLAKVKEAIDKLVTELLQEKKLEIKQRDTCVQRIQENKVITERYQRDKSDMDVKIEGLKGQVAELTELIKTLNTEIADLQLQIKRRGEDRELENRDFQSTVADQRETQVLLKKALAVLKAVYKTTEVTATAPVLVQRMGAGAAQPQAAPAGFATYGQDRASAGVLGLLEQIMRDAAAMEQEAVRAEQKVQKEYEAFVRDSNVAIQSKQKAIVNKSGAKSKAEQDLLATEEDLRAKATELTTLASTADAIKLDCDFVVRNFDIRQEARDQEVEALRQAKAVLSGMQLE